MGLAKEIREGFRGDPALPVGERPGISQVDKWERGVIKADQAAVTCKSKVIIESIKCSSLI